MNAPTLELKYTWQCSHCGAREEQTYQVPLGAEVPKPVLPPNWQMIEKAAYCGRHTVKVWALVETADEAPKLLQDQRAACGACPLKCGSNGKEAA